jgi:hypothetical protein
MPEIGGNPGKGEEPDLEGKACADAIKARKNEEGLRAKYQPQPQN